MEDAASFSKTLILMLWLLNKFDLQFLRTEIMKLFEKKTVTQCSKDIEELLVFLKILSLLVEGGNKFKVS
jgi:hypothetical protein